MANNDFLCKDVWDNTLKAISEDARLQINGMSEETLTYFDGSRLVECDGERAVILVPKDINLVIMKEYKTLIETHLGEILGREVLIKIIKEKENDQEQIQEHNQTQNSFIKLNNINPEYTFANFVTGQSNIQAQFACLTCATNPGITYNPLFIYGSSGVGKTHLLQAVANKALETDKNKKIVYISGEDFVEGVREVSKINQNDKFKESFYDADLLIVDDIEFLHGNKEKSQEMFFSIFTKLINNKKQICLAADKLPSEIPGLEERLITRFNQGLVVNINAPEYETAYKIVQNKIMPSTVGLFQIDDEVLSYIASNFSKNVRAIEGAVTRLIFYMMSEMQGQNHIDLKTAKEALKILLLESHDELSIEKVKKVVSDYYNLTKQQLISQDRTKNIATARQIAMYLCRKHLDSSFDTIGSEFGDRDHSTVISSYKKIEHLIETDSLYMRAISDIEGRLFQH